MPKGEEMSKAEIIGWVIGSVLALSYPLIVMIHYLFIRKGF